MRKQYDFSKGVRGVHAARYREGVRIAVTDSTSDLESDFEAAIDAKDSTSAPSDGARKQDGSEAQVRAKNAY